jgi:translocation and assembly module TamB
VQKLFGAGSVKIDPNYLGAFGNSTSRITVQEQFGRIVTLTYATDVNTTSQQLLQAEVAINRHVSLVVARDESGVFSMVVKATRRYQGYIPTTIPTATPHWPLPLQRPA